MSKTKEVYIIDVFLNRIIIIKTFNSNKNIHGFMKTGVIDPKLSKDDLNNFIGFDIESVTDLGSLEKVGDTTTFDPIMI
jgi:hypothetical protein